MFMIYVNFNRNIVKGAIQMNSTHEKSKEQNQDHESHRKRKKIRQNPQQFETQYFNG